MDDVSFRTSPPARRWEELVGESGCGKTTVGRTLLRLIEPTAGQVRFAGSDVTDLRRQRSCAKACRCNMQIVFQDPFGSLNPRMTVRAIVEEGLIVHRAGNSQQRLDRVCSEGARAVRPRPPLSQSLSARILRRPAAAGLSIAGVGPASPLFLVLDPNTDSSTLDVSIQSQIINLLVELRERMKLTYLFISHDLSVVEYISDRVAVMYLGEIVETGTSQQLYRQPLHPYSHALLSAVPTLDPVNRRRRIVLEGDVPSPIDPPSGCRFHPRCPLAMDVCRTAPPPRALWDLAGHKVRCHAVGAAVFQRNDRSRRFVADDRGANCGEASGTRRGINGTG